MCVFAASTTVPTVAKAVQEGQDAPATQDSAEKPANDGKAAPSGNQEEGERKRPKVETEVVPGAPLNEDLYRKRKEPGQMTDAQREAAKRQEEAETKFLERHADELKKREERKKKIAATAIRPGVTKVVPDPKLLEARAKPKPAAPVDTKLKANPKFDKAIQFHGERLRSGDTEQKVKSAAAIALTRDARAVPILNAALSDSELKVRVAAASGLGVIAAPEAAPGLIGALADADSSVRVHAAEGLGTSVAPEALGPLSRAIADKDPSVRAAAAEALISYDRNSALEMLQKALLDSDSGVRDTVAESLGYLGDTRAIPSLVGVLQNDAVPSVRATAAYALGTIGDQSAVSALTSAARRDRDEVVRKAALEAIDDINYPDEDDE